MLLAFDRPLERRALELRRWRRPACRRARRFRRGRGRARSGRQRAACRSTASSSTAAEGAAAAGSLLAKARELNRQAQRARHRPRQRAGARRACRSSAPPAFDAYLVRPVRPASMMMHLGLRAARRRTPTPAHRRAGAKAGAARRRRIGHAARAAGRGQRDQLAARQARAGEVRLRLHRRDQRRRGGRGGRAGDAGRGARHRPHPDGHLHAAARRPAKRRARSRSFTPTAAGASRRRPSSR